MTSESMIYCQGDRFDPEFTVDSSFCNVDMSWLRENVMGIKEKLVPLNSKDCWHSLFLPFALLPLALKRRLHPPSRICAVCTPRSASSARYKEINVTARKSENGRGQSHTFTYFSLGWCRTVLDYRSTGTRVLGSHLNFALNICSVRAWAAKCLLTH